MRILGSDVGRFVRFVEPFHLPLAQQGLVRIEGENRDTAAWGESNGSSKSMLFEAPVWSLFGKMIRHGNARLGVDLIGEADVSTTFESARGVFRSHRRLNTSHRVQLSARVDDVWVPVRGQSPDVRDAPDDAARLLGFDYTTLRSAFFLQGRTMGVSTYAAEMRILESILRFDVYSGGSEVAKKRVTAIDTEARSTLDDIARLSQQIELSQRSIQDLETLDESDRERELTEQLTSAHGDVAYVPRYERQVEKHYADVQALDQEFMSAEGDRRVAVARQDRSRLLLDDKPIPCVTCEQLVSPEHAHALAVGADADVVRTTAVVTVKRAQLMKAKERLAATRETLDRLVALRRALKNDERELTALLDRKTKRLERIAAQTQQLAQFTERLDALQDSVIDARRQSFIGKSGRETLDEMKPKTLAAAAPILNAAALRYSEILCDGAIRITFNPMRESRSENLISVEGETGPTYESLSSGEQRRADLIITLARRDLARWRIGEPINFVFMDEIFDPLDETGLQRVMQIIQQDQDEMESIFIVTHRPELRAMLPAARTWRVIREHGHASVHFDV